METEILPMFYFRADANKDIATGHIMRCISIADELKKRNINSTFITADTNGETLIRSKGYQMICLNSCWNNLEKELDTLIHCIKEKEIKKLIIDSYSVTDTYLKEISKYTKIIYMDDLGVLTYPVNTIINYNIYGENLNYRKHFEKNKVNLLLGGQYVPLREEFQIVKPVFRKKVKQILISTGGGDLYDVAGSLVKGILKDKELSDFHFNIISGKFNHNYEQLQQLSKAVENITIVQNVQEMSKLMLEMDIAVTAGGSTMYELCACEVAMILFTFADNQLEGAKEFSKRAAAIYAGDVRDDEETIVFYILENIKKLSNNWEKRHEMISNAAANVNRNGVSNLVDEIENV